MAVGTGERRGLSLLVVVPVLLLGPIVATGRVFLPQLATGLEPFRSEAPERAREARAGMNYVQADRLFPVLTDQLALRAALFDGELPTWEPLLGLGVPLFAESIAGAAYPPNWLGLLFPPERAAGPLAALSLFLAGLGMWLFLGRRGLSPGARVVGTLAYQLGGWGVANLFYYMKFDAALWLPWALWAVEGIARDRRWSGAWLALAISASLLAGMLTIGVFVAGLSLLYAVLRLTPLARRLGLADGEDTPSVARPVPRLPGAGLFVALGVVGASILLVPALESSRQSERRDVSRTQLEAMSLPATTVLGTVVCDLVGAPTEDTPPGRLPVAWWLTPAQDVLKADTANQLEWNTYAGAVVVLLALVGVVAMPRRALVPGALLLGVLGFAQGWPGVRWLYLVPGLNVGEPGRALGLAWALWPWLAALGAEAWIRRLPRAAGTLFGLGFAACALAFASWSTLEPARWASDLEDELIERYAETHAPTRAEVRARLPIESTIAAGERLETSLGLLFGAMLAALAAGAIGVLLGRPRANFGRAPPRWIFGLGLVLLLVLAVTPPFQRSFSSALGPPPALLVAAGALALGLLVGASGRATDALVRWLPFALAILAEGVVASHGHVSGRVLDGELFPRAEAIEAVRLAAGDGRAIRYDPSESGLEHVENLARPNMLQPYGVGDLTPWIVFPPRTFNELFAAFDPRSRRAQGVARLSDTALLGHPLLDLVRVGAVLSRDPITHPRLEPVLERPGFCVYRRAGALPPARLVPEAIAAAGDQAALAVLAAGVVAFDRQTLLAPEHAASVRAASENAGELVRFERPARGRRLLEVRGSEGGWLVLHEQHYPGWEVSVDGERAELLRADHVYMAVRVPSGNSVIEFRYAPHSLSLGLGLTVLALAGSLFASRRLRF